MIVISSENLKQVLRNCFETDQKIILSGKNLSNGLKIEHEAIIKYIIDNFGFISIEKYGQESFVHMCLLIQHLDKTPENIKYREKYLKLFEANMVDINSPDAPIFNDYYALQTDRFLRHQGLPQKYGTQVYYDPKTDQYLSEETEDLEKLADRRQKLKLEPIENYLSRFKN